MNNIDHQTNLAIKGWQIDHISSTDIHSAHRFYLVEPEKESLCQINLVPIHGFKAISAAPSALQYTNFVNQALLSLTNKGLEISPEEFVTILVSYYKATEAYKNTQKDFAAGQAMDVLINLYGTVGSLSTAIRPVTLQQSEMVYPSEEIMEIAKYVMEQDKTSNPEYFK